LLSGALAFTAISWGPDAPQASARPSGPLVPATGTLFGAWIKPADGANQSEKKAMYLTREAEIGRRFDIASRYYGFTQNFPTWTEAWDKQMGRISSVAWAGTDTLAVKRGDHDSIIRARARDVAAFGDPIFIRWFWEMDGNYNASKAHTPADYIAAWKRIRQIFREEGATNAVWTWCTTAWGMSAGFAQQWYPGDNEVDWVCSNGYNWAPDRPGDEWRDWEWIYRPTHNFAVAHNKPMMAGEWGALERGTKDKAFWINNAADTIANDMPNLAAIVVFDERRYNSRDNHYYNWRVDSSANTKLAFMAMARDPHFTRRTPKVLPTISVGDASIWEGNSGSVAQRFAVSLSAPTSDKVTVRFRTTHANTNGTDFTSQDRVITLAPGRTREEISVPIGGDTSNEGHEHFVVTLSNPTNAVLADRTGTGTIYDEDPLPTTGVRLAVGDATVVEGDTGTRTIRIPVTLSRASSGVIAVVYGVVPDGAEPSDYTTPSTTGLLAFPAGSRSASVLIVVNGDFGDEGAERIVVAISGQTAGIISDATGSLTIVNDD
jgi:hypothetical protein